MLVCHVCAWTGSGSDPTCPRCGGPLLYDPYAAVRAVAEAARRAEDAERSRAVEAALDAYLIDLPAGVIPEPREDGRFTFSSHELIRAGYQRRLQESDLVRSAGVIFEILGYSYTGRIYIARVFRTEGPDTVADLPKTFRLPRRRKKKKEES